MNEIIEKDVKSLKSKGKKIRTAIKRTIIGLVVTATIISTIPTIKFHVALSEAKNSTYISDVLNNEKTRFEQVKEIFQEAINKNPNLDNELKEKVIKSFSEYVLDKYAGFFTRENIENMYAVAKTERVHEMSNFAKEHSWWGGDYNSYFNSFSVNDFNDDATIAHEQLHAITKNGAFGSGFAHGFYGYGSNEGVTGFMTNNTYYHQKSIMNNLCLILGYDSVIPYYLNGDINGFKEELSKYLSDEEVNSFISDLDTITFSDYLIDFAINNKLGMLFGDNYNNIIKNKKILEESLKQKVEKICLDKTNSSSKYAYLYNNLYGEHYKPIYYSNIDEINEDIAFYEIELYDEKNVVVRLIQRPSSVNPFVEEYIIPYDKLGSFDISSKINIFQDKNDEVLIEKGITVHR